MDFLCIYCIIQINRIFLDMVEGFCICGICFKLKATKSKYTAIFHRTSILLPHDKNTKHTNNYSNSLKSISLNLAMQYKEFQM